MNQTATLPTANLKLLVIGDKERTEKYLPDHPLTHHIECVVMDRGSSDDELLRAAGDASFIMADAISPVSAYLIEHMPNLRLIHSEGVAYNSIDCEAAHACGIAVCNNAGVNASAVAEQAILLMLACLRDAIQADAHVRAAEQIQTKERMMVAGIRELGDCTVGLVGFGAIAQAVARRLQGWNCTVLYHKRNPISTADEAQLGVRFAPMDELARTCDIVSLHVPVTNETTNLVDAAFLANMKPNAILINTARGEIVDTEALARALEENRLKMAGLDTIAPEPVTAENPLLNLSEQAASKLVLSPHIGGVTEGMFYRAHRAIWENIARVVAGEHPLNQVN